MASADIASSRHALEESATSHRRGAGDGRHGSRRTRPRRTRAHRQPAGGRASRGLKTGRGRPAFWTGWDREWRPLARRGRWLPRRPHRRPDGGARDRCRRLFPSSSPSLGPDVRGVVIALNDVTDVSRASACWRGGRWPAFSRSRTAWVGGGRANSSEDPHSVQAGRSLPLFIPMLDHCRAHTSSSGCRLPWQSITASTAGVEASRPLVPARRWDPLKCPEHGLDGGGLPNLGGTGCPRPSASRRSATHPTFRNMHSLTGRSAGKERGYGFRSVVFKTTAIDHSAIPRRRNSRQNSQFYTIAAPHGQVR